MNKRRENLLGMRWQTECDKAFDKVEGVEHQFISDGTGFPFDSD